MNPNPNILIVDDDDPFLYLVREEFVNTEFNLITSNNPLHALEIIKTQPIDLLISDVNMPEMDGFQLCEKTRQILPELPILILTNVEDFGAIEKAYDVGATDFIYKPNQWPWQLLPYRIRYLLKAQQAFEDAHFKKAAEQANQAKSDFLSKMAHEIRTPVSAVMSFAELLESETDNPTHLKWLKHIFKSSQYLAELLSDVLNLAQIEAGQTELHFQKMNAVDIIKSSIDLISHQTEETQIDIQFQPSMTEDFTLFVDPTRLQQIILNLLSNAIKYNKANGKIEVSLRKQDNKIQIAVADTGFGITPEQQQKLFQPFNRLGQGKNIAGTGIGLTITKKLVEALQGEISLQSEHQQGTTFFVTLPLSQIKSAE